jgi:hypothetical protein
MQSNTAFTGSEITYYRFGHDHMHPTYASNPADCCIICSLEPLCKGWTYDTPKTKRYWLDDISPAESDNKRYQFEKWAGQEYRDYAVSKRVGSRCRLWSVIDRAHPTAESFSGRQGDLKMAMKKQRQVQADKTAVVLRTTGPTIPTAFIAKWAKQLAGVAQFWVFVDTSQCEGGKCKDTNKLPAAKKSTADIVNLHWWEYKVSGLQVQPVQTVQTVFESREP